MQNMAGIIIKKILLILLISVLSQLTFNPVLITSSTECYYFINRGSLNIYYLKYLSSTLHCCDKSDSNLNWKDTLITHVGEYSILSL